MNRLAELVEIGNQASPINAPSPKDWVQVETDLGKKLPIEYKAFVEHFVPGEFGCGLVFLSPTEFNEFAWLRRDSLIQFRETVSYIEQSANVSLYPEENGLLYIGNCDRQYLFLQSNQSDGFLDTVSWIDFDYETVLHTSKSITAFIYDLYTDQELTPKLSELRKWLWRNNKLPFFRRPRRPS